MNGLSVLLKKLIRSGAGRKRFVAAVIGLSVAMVLILAAVQIQSDYNELLFGKNNKDSIANFLVVNKVLTDKNIGATSLSQEEITDLKNQPFVESVGLLTPSRFKASIQSASDRFPFYTDIAFESVPDEFLDITSKDWHWDEGQQFVPIIVPGMFLDFYNFQFSFSQNLPQLTREVVKMIGFKVNMYTRDGVISFPGRVVGFSDRVSSLLVPQQFMNWANTKAAGTGQNINPSRVIIQTKDPGNPALTEYLKSKNLAADADKTRFSRYRRVVDVIVNISWGTGASMLFFALLIFTMFIQLTVTSCKEEIRLLLQLGASPKQLRKFLFWQFLPVNYLVCLLTLGIIQVLQVVLHEMLAKQNISIPFTISTNVFFAALAVLLLISGTIFLSIKRYTQHNPADTNIRKFYNKYLL